MKELIVVIDDKFPMLEYLHISLHSDMVWHFPLCFKHRNYGTLFWLTLPLPWILTIYTSHAPRHTVTCDGRLIRLLSPK